MCSALSFRKHASRAMTSNVDVLMAILSEKAPDASAKAASAAQTPELAAFEVQLRIKYASILLDEISAGLPARRYTADGREIVFESPTQHDARPVARNMRTV